MDEFNRLDIFKLTALVIGMMGTALITTYLPLIPFNEIINDNPGKIISSRKKEIKDWDAEIKLIKEKRNTENIVMATGLGMFVNFSSLVVLVILKLMMDIQIKTAIIIFLTIEFILLCFTIYGYYNHYKKKK